MIAAAPRPSRDRAVDRAADREATVIATLLVWPDWLADLDLDAADLLDPLLARALGAMRTLAAANRPIDLATVCDAMDVGDAGALALAELVDVPDALMCRSLDSLRDLTREIRREAIERRVARAASTLRERPHDGEALATMRALLDARDAIDSRASALRVLTPEEFARDLAPEPIVAGLLYAASTTSLNGASKTGKTWAALQLSMCVASGVEFLGLEVRRARVLYLSLELSAGMLCDRMELIASDAGVRMPRIGDEFHVVAPTRDYLPRLDLSTGDGRSALRRLIAETRAGVVVLDTLYRFTGDLDPSDNRDMGRLFAALNDVAAASSAGLLLLDHAGKGERLGPVSHSAIGASVKGGSARTIAELRRTSREDGGRWALDVESHFGSWEEPRHYERPRRANGERGAGCVPCSASEAHGISLTALREVFAEHGDEIDGRRTFASRRKLIEALEAAKLASGHATGEEIVRAILRDHCAPESSGWRGADRPIMTSPGPRNATVFRWRGDLDGISHDA